MGRRRVSVAALEEAGILIDLATGGELRAERLWGGPAPLEVDLGCGRGHFLAARARAAPEALLLGVERAYKYALLAADRVRREGVRNARVVCMDALDALELALPAGAVRAVYVNFPDPWPKRRHHKRRLFTPRFAAALARVLQPGGSAFVLTDDPEIFAVARHSLDACAALAPQPFAVHAPGRPWSAYERKWRAAGRAILGGRWVRRGRAPRGWAGPARPD